MIYNLARRTFTKGLLTSLRQSYGELIYTQKLDHTSSFSKVPTYRLIDLEGNLLVKDHKYDTKLLLKILKTMIFVDEMDALLLKVKSQGKTMPIQGKYPSI